VTGQQRPVAAGRVVLAAAAGALLAVLLGTAQSPDAHALPATDRAAADLSGFAVPAVASVSTVASVSAVPASDAMAGAAAARASGQAAGLAPGAVYGAVSVDAMSAAEPQLTPYLLGLFGRKPSADQIAAAEAREELPAFGSQPLAVNGVGTVYVPPDGIGMVPDGDSADIQAGLTSSSAAFAPADLPMPPSSGSPQLPHTVYLAYLSAEARERRSRPGCHLDWPMLAGIGEIESSQAYAGRVLPDGTSYPGIYGPVLDGSGGYSAVPDTDHGRLDGNRIWDRAVGPMQFMPTTWEEWGVDGNGDGRADPQNIYDAALTTAHYLCANGRDLSVPSQYYDAVINYNEDANYVAAVRAWAGYYRQGITQQFHPRPHPQPRPPVTGAPSAPAAPSSPPGPGPSGSASAPGPASGSASGSASASPPGGRVPGSHPFRPSRPRPYGSLPPGSLPFTP
jgi:hypothetical protein